MDQIPTARQSQQSTGSDSAAYQSNVVSGNVLVAAYYSAAAITTPTIADTRGSTWTLRASPTGGGGILGGTFYIWTATAAGSGADTVTLTESGATSFSLSILEISHVTELVDVVSTATNTVSSGTITMPNATTTKYRDFILDCLLIGGQVGGPHDVSFTSDIFAQIVTIGVPNQIFYDRLSANPGTVSGAVYTTTAGGGSAGLQVVLALRSTSALTVSTPSIPDAVVSQAYSFQLQATGGTGTNVWSINSGTLPCGLSLSSGGVISGTPTCANGNTIQFKVTDAATATATANLTLHVAASANTIARVQGASGNVLNGVTAGNTILFGVMNTTAFASAYAQTPTLSDGLGTTYTLIPGATNDLVQLFWGIAGGSGNINMTVAPALSSGFVWVSEWTNMQPIFDTGVVSKYNSTTGSSPISSAAITSPVAEMLYAFSSPGTQAATITVSAPFSRDINASGGVSARQSESDYYVSASSGSNTATWTQTGNTSNQLNMTLLGFRPTTTGTAPVASARHGRSQIY